jgi:hypothetical protein
MKRGGKWALGLGLAAAVVAAAWFIAARQLPSDAEITDRLVAEAGQRLGVEVTIGSAHWQLLPRPALVVNDFRTRQAQPIVIGQLAAYAGAGSLLDRKLVIERIVIRDAVFPRDSVRAFRGKLDASEAGAEGRVALARFEFRNVTWIPYGGIAVAYDGEIDFDADWRPRRAECWRARIQAGGGTMHGEAALEFTANAAMRLQGELTPRDIEVASLMSTFNRRSPVSGKGSGRTVLSASGETVSDLVRSLNTRTVFSVSPATVLRYDLDKAIRTLGKERDGETVLEELTGQMETQNTDEGLRATYTGIKARSGRYSATGEATVYRRQVEGGGVLYLGESGAKVPFTVSGPVTKPRTRVAPVAFAGAAVSRAGAGFVEALRRLFKGGEGAGTGD